MRHWGVAGATGKQTALLLDRSRGALVCCVPIDRSAWRRCTSNKSVVFGAAAAALVKRNMKHIQ